MQKNLAVNVLPRNIKIRLISYFLNVPMVISGERLRSKLWVRKVALGNGARAAITNRNIVVLSPSRIDF